MFQASLAGRSRTLPEPKRTEAIEYLEKHLQVCTSQMLMLSTTSEHGSPAAATPVGLGELKPLTQEPCGEGQCPNNKNAMNHGYKRRRDTN
jgi:hypothetical protein